MPKKKLKGTIVSDAMQKTVVVSVGPLCQAPEIQKIYEKTNRYKAHDEKEEYNVGDKVVIQECLIMSKDKHFEVLSKI